MPRRGQGRIKPIARTKSPPRESANSANSASAFLSCRQRWRSQSRLANMARMRHRGPAALLLGLAVAACGDHSLPPPPPGFAYAYAAPSCAPWDGPAVSLVLRSNALAGADTLIEGGDDPQLRVSIYPREAGGLTRRSYRWPHQPEEAAGARCEAGQCQPIPSGGVTILTLRADSVVTGELKVRLQQGGTLQGGFRAPWRSRRYFCG
jgi:hypothetical protein